MGTHSTAGMQGPHRDSERMDKANCQVATEQGERAEQRRGDGAVLQLGRGERGHSTGLCLRREHGTTLCLQ